MAQFNVHEAKSSLSQLLEMVERGEDVVVARHGRPVARLIGIQPKQSILGIGTGDPNYRDLPDEQLFAPMSQQELADWYGGECPGESA